MNIKNSHLCAKNVITLAATHTAARTILLSILLSIAMEHKSGYYAPQGGQTPILTCPCYPPHLDEAFVQISSS